MKIEDTETLMGFAWKDDDTGLLNWALKEDFEDVDPSDRPKDCTPVVIEITPTVEWVTKKQKEHDYFGDLQDQINKFTGDLQKLQKALKTDG